MGPNEEIRLSLPGLAVYGRVARLAVTGLASRLGFTYDEVEDLRIAIGELCGVLLDGDEGRVTLRCQVAAGGLRIEATRDPVGGALVVPALSRDILQAVVDDVEIVADDARIAILKRRQG